MRTPNLLALVLLSTLSATAFAQTATDVPAGPSAQPPSSPAAATPAPTPAPAAALAPTELAFAEPAKAEPMALSTTPPTPAAKDEDAGWQRPVGRRFLHGFRLGYTNIRNYDKPVREGAKSIKEEFGLKTPHMMLLGYEGFYRIVGQSWLNVLLVGNISIAGLEQSKFIPAASGLIGFEFDESFQLGIGVNLLPDPQAPTHMIAAAGWTPRVGSIHTPVHFFIVPDTEGNHRWGGTVGMTW